MARVPVFVVCLGLLTACAETPAGVQTSVTRSAAASGNVERVLHLNASAAPGGDGSGRRPFQRISDAVQAANALDGARIVVAPGTYTVTASVHIESGVSIVGSNVMQLDDQGLPTGVLDAGTEARFLGTTALADIAMFVVGDADVLGTHDVTIANVTMQAIAGAGFTVLVMNTQKFAIRNNLMKGPARFGVNTATSTGSINGNHITGATCGACIGGGNASSPASVELTGNRIIGMRNGAILLNGSGTDVNQFADQLDATVVGNDLSNSVAGNGTGFGLRIFVIRRDPGQPADTQSTGNIRALVKGNRIANNQIGIILDSGFSYRTFEGVCDSRTYSGTIDLTLRGNTLTGSTRAPALISFNRSVVYVQPAMLASWQYLHNSTYKVSDPEGTMAGYALDHKTHDPYIGVCPNDQASEPLFNHFEYNGVPVAASTP